MLGIAAGAALLAKGGLVPAIAAFFLYQLHILSDYVDGELARVNHLESVKGAYYDLIVGRLTKPVVLYSAVIGTWFSHRGAPGASLDLFFGTLIVAGFLLDKEAVDVWYRANQGGEVENPYVVRSERAFGGPQRVIVRVVVAITSIQAFLVYQIAAAILVMLGAGHFTLFGTYDVTPRSAILIPYAVAFPALAIARSIYIARTGHIPRRQDLVRDA